MLRTVTALAVGVTLAVVAGLVLGEYPFVGFTPYVAAIVVPAGIGGAISWVGDRSSAPWWAAASVLGAGAIGWALWISTGRGDDPVPAAGWIAVGAALLWPLLWAGRLARRPRPSSSR